jgi:anti-sigma-K factor RskA
MTVPPDFDELIGEGLEPGERERLRRVHDLLVASGPPPELSPRLAELADEQENVFPLFPKRRWAAGLALAAALAAAMFGAGFFVGGRSADEPDPERIIAMVAPVTAQAGRASLAVFAKDAAGNWPMELTVRDLAELPEGEEYELWLTRDGKLKEPCGTFVVHEGTTVVPLNAPYRLRQFDGWVVVRRGTTQPVLTT